MLAAGSANCQVPAPRPPDLLEFFEPTARQHSLSAQCHGGGSASLAWDFDGKSATLRTFMFDGRSLAAQQLAQMQTWMSEIDSDVLILFECGDHKAVLIILDGQLAGTGRGRAIRVHLNGGVLSEVTRYNFDR